MTTVVPKQTGMNQQEFEELFRHGYSDGQIGDMLGRTRGAVAVTLNRARARLKELMGEESKEVDQKTYRPKRVDKSIRQRRQNPRRRSLARGWQSHGARAFHTTWMAVDVHTVYLLVCLVISPSFRTNDRNGVTSLVQRCDLRPDPAIGRHRRVFD